MSEEFNFDLNNNKLRRLEGAGSLVRMSDDRTVETVFLGQPEGRKKTGIPEFMWLDCSVNELTLMGAKRWKKKAEEEICMGCLSEGGNGNTVRIVL